MPRQVLRIVSFIAVVLLAPAAFTQSLAANAAETTRKLRETQRKLSRFFSVKGEFIQDFTCGSTKLPDRFTGTFELKQKGRYRFNYLEPPGKLMVSDGTDAYVYDKTAGIVIANHLADKLLSAVAGLLLGKSEGEFIVEEMNRPMPAETGLTVIRLIPVEPYSFIQQVLLTLSDESPYVRRIVIVDNAGCIIRTTFTDVAINTGIRDNRFRFVPPKNAVILAP